MSTENTTWTSHCACLWLAKEEREASQAHSGFARLHRKHSSVQTLIAIVIVMIFVATAERIQNAFSSFSFPLCISKSSGLTHEHSSA